MSMQSSGFKPCTEPGRAVAQDGIVLLDGPDGVAVAMTPDAADSTAASLHAAAQQARRSPIQNDEPQA